MKWVFWASLLIILYAYIGYPGVLYVWRLVRRRGVREAERCPTISVVIVVRNEADAIDRKMRNLLSLHYPPDRLEVVAVSDGSTDGTAALLHKWVDSRMRVFHCEEHLGKATAINWGVSQACGEIIVFTDARQEIESQAIRFLVSNFADPKVAGVSGELVLRGQEKNGFAGGLALYWRYEKWIRQWESDIGSVVGATGALYAIRRSLFTPLPPETILDDVYLPLSLVRQGYRVVLDRRASVLDWVSGDRTQEFPRKVRTLGGVWQLLGLCPWVMSPFYPLSFQFLSHKFLRLLVPAFLVLLFVSNLFLVSDEIYKLLAIGQACFYTLAACRAVWSPHSWVGRLGSLPYVFITLNLAAVLGVLRPKLEGKWQRKTTEFSMEGKYTQLERVC